MSPALSIFASSWSHLGSTLKRYYRYVEPETGRLYRLDNLVNPNQDRPNLTYEFLGVTKVWRWTKERMEQAYQEGLVVQQRPGSVPSYKRYLDEMRGNPVDTIWTDIPPINPMAKERLGYPTQKPLALLESHHPGQQPRRRCNARSILWMCNRLRRRRPSQPLEGRH